ncbi:MAG: hypothetical protein HYT93_00225 [Parcubacteria group bacterium]|nr:hypothetical protein [Parcubacteria group bacterium]
MFIGALEMNALKFFLSLLYALIEALWILFYGMVSYPIYFFKKVSHILSHDDGKIKCSLCAQDISNKPDKIKVEVHSGDVFYFCDESHSYIHFFLSGWSY